MNATIEAALAGDSGKDFTVEHAVADSGHAADEIKTASLELSRQAEFLNDEVSKFLDHVRALNSSEKSSSRAPSS